MNRGTYDPLPVFCYHYILPSHCPPSLKNIKGYNIIYRTRERRDGINSHEIYMLYADVLLKFPSPAPPSFPSSRDTREREIEI